MTIEERPRRLKFLDPLLRVLGRALRRPAFDDAVERTWARQIRAYIELPAAYRPFFDHLERNQMAAFPYTVLTPTSKVGDGRPDLGRLVTRLGTNIQVVDYSDQGLKATTYPIQNLYCAERGSILLDAWVTLRGQDSDGTLSSTTLRFNSVTEHIMAPLVESMRAPTTAGPSADLEMERNRLSFLGETHFKFRSYGQASLRPGARVVRIVFQPEIRSNLLRLFGFSLSRLEWPAHLCILSDSELILIRDDDTQRWSKGSPHGAIWTYIPRRHVRDASIARRDARTVVLSIDLPGGVRIEQCFDLERTGELEQLCGDLRS